MTFERSIHHLSCRGVVHVQAVLTYHMTLTVRLCRERHWTLWTSERLLAYIVNEQPSTLICLNSTTPTVTCANKLLIQRCTNNVLMLENKTVFHKKLLFNWALLKPLDGVPVVFFSSCFSTIFLILLTLCSMSCAQLAVSTKLTQEQKFST